VKGAFLLSEDRQLFAELCDVLVRIGAEYTADDDVLQLRDDRGRLLTVIGRVEPEFEWEFRQGPFTLEGNAWLPDMSSVTACIVECRWEDLFASVVARIASELEAMLWVLDSNGHLWLASEVDPARISL
jgi:hypothetical protein